MSTAVHLKDSETKSRGGINAVWRHPLAFLGLIFLASLPVAGVWYFSPRPKYSATVVFHISSQPQMLLSSTPENWGDFTTYKQLQMATLKSRGTLNAALNEPNVRNLSMVQTAQPDPLTWLETALTVETDSNHIEFMRATIVGENAEELPILLNAVSKAYLAVVSERDHDVRNRRLDILEKTYGTAKNELRKYHNRMDGIATTLGSKDGVTLAVLDALRQDSLREAIHEQVTHKDQLSLATLNLSAMKIASTWRKRSATMAVTGAFWVATLPKEELLTQPIGPQLTIPPAAIEEELRRDPVLREFDMAIDRARRALKDVEALFPPDANPPAVFAARANLKAAEEKRDRYYNEARAKVEALLNEKSAQNEKERFAAIQAEYDRLKAQVDRAASKIVELQQEISKLNVHKIEIENLKMEIVQKEKMCSLLADEIELLKIEGNAPARVTVMEEPFIVGKIEEDRRWSYALLAGLIVFLVGFGALVGWEYRRRRATPSATTPS